LVIIIVITKKKRGDIFVYLLRGIAKRPTRNKQSIPRLANISILQQGRYRLTKALLFYSSS
ncbi:MAG: hypothetical protein IKS64_04585, partial [Muribaculaceae bacterium]|nr:hypothetical protein [Muribaculaceae bacterium]